MSLRLRIAGLLAGITALMCVVSGFTINEWAERNRAERVDENLEKQIESFLSGPRLANVFGGERIFRQRYGSDQGTWLSVEIPTKIIFSISGSPDVVVESEGFPNILIPSTAGFFKADDSITTWRAKVTIRRPIPSSSSGTLLGGGSTGRLLEAVTVVSAISDDRDMTARSDLRKAMTRVGLFATLLSAAIGWFLGGHALRSFERLRAEAGLVRVTEDLSKRVDTRGPAEITALAEDINSMLTRLESASLDTARALTNSREFGSNVAHELRTPLTSMRLNLDLLLGADLEPDEQASILEQMLLQQDRLLRTLDALRLLSRGDLAQGESNFEEVDLIDIINEAVKREFNSYKNVRLSLDLSNEIPLVMGWREGLDVAFRNIFENIMAHAVRPDEKLAVNVTANYTHGEVCISIEDNGPGIAATDHVRVLERFYQVTGTKGLGSGLGLSLVDQQMVIHGGRIAIGESDLGGVLIALTFPVEKNNQR